MPNHICKLSFSLYIFTGKVLFQQVFNKLRDINILVYTMLFLYKIYSKRWGIETGYRTLDHDLKLLTTSSDPLIRIFYFLFSVCLYNLWVLVNLCLSMTLHGRVKEKPILTAKLFALVLYRVQIDPG